MSLRQFARRLLAQQPSLTGAPSAIHPATVGQRSEALHTTVVASKSEDRRQMKASLPAKDEGTLGERTANIDAILTK